ncbi:hypothetical protein L873DRAFT_1812354 [Choiromyces venosus 120613-1]|uniref:Uncharacterized protein n=1 Tax=Choiromyces venosus 120613-1 TaxID=1336337 RepID=A0A3N4JC10_9PEZI|nr:hypothetical protein L873DRAFT_1812354 [Choiromyces venosus 120613-1]
MEKKTIVNSHSFPPKLYISRTPLQRAAITINALANSEYLAHFPGITQEDVAYAKWIVQCLPSNTSNSTTPILAFAISTSMSLASSGEFEAYASLQNAVTAHAILEHWKLVKTSRKFSTPIPFIKSSGNCINVWDALEKCWGRKVAEDSWVDYVTGDGKEGRDNGGKEAGGHERSAASREKGDLRDRPWKRAHADLLHIDTVGTGSGEDSDGEESQDHREKTNVADPDSMPTNTAAGRKGANKKPNVKTRKRAGSDSLLIPPPSRVRSSPPCTRSWSQCL